MRLDLAIRETADAEEALADLLLKLGERHKADHDVYHLSRTLAKISQGHVQTLAQVGARYEAGVSDGDVRESSGPLARLREKASELTGSMPQAGVLLLRDLRTLHLAAAEASINWTILGQGAQAARDRELLDTVSRCHADTLRILKWTTTRIKVAAPQVLMG